MAAKANKSRVFSSSSCCNSFFLGVLPFGIFGKNKRTFLLRWKNNPPHLFWEWNNNAKNWKMSSLTFGNPESNSFVVWNTPHLESEWEADTNTHALDTHTHKDQVEDTHTWWWMERWGAEEEETRRTQLTTTRLTVKLPNISLGSRTFFFLVCLFVLKNVKKKKKNLPSPCSPPLASSS